MGSLESSIYEKGLDEISTYGVSEDIRQDYIDKWKNINLHTVWMKHKCVNTSILISSDEEEFEIYKLSNDEDIKELISRVKSSYDLAVDIAARGGDEWGLHINFPSRREPQFMDDFFEFHPSLVHRFLASIWSGLTPQEQHWHMVKSYQLDILRNENIEMSLKEYLKKNPIMNAMSLEEMLDVAGPISEEEFLSDQERIDRNLKYPWRLDKQTD